MVDTTTFSNPFPGLRSYEYEDHSLFFGRDSHITELKNKLLDGRFLALIGSSGSGKSSLIKAGLIPSLERSGEDLERWAVMVFRPGASPVRNFVAAMKAYLRREDHSWESKDLAAVERDIIANPEYIFELFSVVKDKNILLVIDQFEEIFRYDFSKSFDFKRNTENPAFINLLLSLINQRNMPVHAVITMRSDYLDHCTEFKGLTEAINKGYYLLPKMNQEEIMEVITRPVETLGATIAPDVVSMLQRKIVDNPDFLPILQHVLMRMWERWKTTKSLATPISLVEYEAVGTMDNSITVHAEEIFTQKLDEKRRQGAEKLFKTLIVLGANDTPALHPTTLREIVKITGIPDYLLIDVVLVFRENGVSFLTPRPGIKIEPESIIDVSVEKILTLWSRCRLWIEQELESAKLYKQLSYSAFLYQDGRTGLWVNPELQMGLKWLKENEPTLEWAQRYDPYFERALNFLDYSKKQYDLEVRQKEDRQKRELRKARTFATILGASSLISLLFLIVALVLRTQAQQSEKNAQEKANQALEQRGRAEDQTKEAISQQKIAEQQGVIAMLQRVLTDRQREKAELAEKDALLQKAQADIAKGIAERQKLKADTATILANQAAASALAARNDAIVQKNEANKARTEAEISRNDAFRQRAKAVARFIAIQSFQMPATEELASLLALRAYQFNVNNGGEAENPDVFNALSKAAGAKSTYIGHNDIVRIITETKDNANILATAGDDGVVNLWNYLVPGSRATPLRYPKQTFKSIRSLTFMPNNNTLFVGTSNGQIIRWDKPSMGSLPTKTLIAHDGMVLRLHVRMDPAGPRLISISSVGQIRIWDISDNRMQVLHNIDLGIDVVASAISPDLKFIYLGSGAGKIVGLELDKLTGKAKEYDFNRLRGRLSALAISPDGKKIYMGTSSGTLYFTGIKDNSEIVINGLSGIQGGHTSGITKIAFTPDGSRMATSCYDWKIRIWNNTEDLSKQQPVVLNDFDNWVMDVRFSNDGKKLFACGADKTVRIWDINSRALFDEISKKVNRDLTSEEWDKYIGKDIPHDKLSITVR
ncbi:hypothetical protein DYBT9275_01997 [Dyadobacter sp. CECT 9275]|uniref:Novel STAND NTPase 1 domain-containing protein n=1 Tax=Dyadobacter helix TaxID=2822344 RepID=A0A916N5I1_9BACT|nr:hypothetical protein [Dyadobacter sp. CECT 9275]CAG4998420.1 hypothetical protein DYBT9275_01997 [Dyadobacter sp. CECT 9275]